MHGLINRAIQCFLRDSFGPETWRETAARAGVPASGFEAMLRYDDAITDRMVAAAARQLDRTPDSLYEDLGTYLVSHPNREGLRRLLRFGGVTFLDFLHSVGDLPGRCRLAVPDLDLPQLDLADEGGGRYSLAVRAAHPGFAPAMMGILRAMADDYGALVLLDQAGREDGAALIHIDLLDQSYASGRRFDLAAGSA